MTVQCIAMINGFCSGKVIIHLSDNIMAYFVNKTHCKLKCVHGLLKHDVINDINGIMSLPNIEIMF